MSTRKLPVRPDLEQLRHQAKDLRRAIQLGDAAAIAELREHCPRVDPAVAKLPMRNMCWREATRHRVAAPRSCLRADRRDLAGRRPWSDGTRHRAP